jgi:hypothetical protein
MSRFSQEAPQRNSSREKSGEPEPIIVAEWPIKRGEIARVSIEPYKGVWLIGLRKWFEAEDGKMRPGKGMSLSVRHLPRIAEAMGKALAVARERGLIPTDQEGGR